VRFIAAAHRPVHRGVMRSANGPPGNGDPIGVVTVDDQAVFRAAARDLIDATPGFRAIGEAASGPEALKLVQEVDPELVLVDVRMPGMDGIETARRLTSLHPHSVVVLISIEDEPNIPTAAATSGAVALVRKQDLNRSTLTDLWSRYCPA
jgi:DNA-binding NarL/FixJ family response regulator